MRTLMVASSGGHLMELHALQERLEPAADSIVWVTFDTAQSRDLLRGAEVLMIPPIAPRAYRTLARSVVPARRILRETDADRVISTGAGIALAFLPYARRRGLSCHYIESAARTDGPSTTGRALGALRAAHLYSQHRSWATGTWHYAGSVFDSVEPVATPSGRSLKKVVVSLGTAPFPFDRLVRRLARVIPSDVDVVWQLGPAARDGLRGRTVTMLPHDELVAEMAEADVVISHAGVGSALAALSVGRCPVLVPRRAARGEHVDEHQLQIAQDLAGRGLAVTQDADDLDLQHLREAAARGTRRSERPPLFRLQGHHARQRRSV